MCRGREVLWGYKSGVFKVEVGRVRGVGVGLGLRECVFMRKVLGVEGFLGGVLVFYDGCFGCV